MPNWCCTDYRIYGDKHARDDLYNSIKYLNSLDEPLIENGFGNLWLGCLVNQLGGDYNNVYCRGDITDYHNFDDHLWIQTETAWGEMDEVRHFIEKTYPSLKIYYMSEEPGMGQYYTNDATHEIFKCKYRVDIGDDTNGLYICDDFMTAEEIAEAINSEHVEDLHVEPDMDKINAAFEKYEEAHEDFYGEIYEYQITD